MRTGDFVAQYVKPHSDGELYEEDIRPYSAELSIGEVYRVNGSVRINNEPGQEEMELKQVKTRVRRV